MAQKKSYYSSNLIWAPRLLALLQKHHPLPAGYKVEVTVEPSPTVTSMSNGVHTLTMGWCCSTPTSSHIKLAGEVPTTALVKTLCHEYKHVLQGATKCRLKKGGKAREAQATAFAEQHATAMMTLLADEGHSGLLALRELLTFEGQCFAGF